MAGKRKGRFFLLFYRVVSNRENDIHLYRWFWYWKGGCFGQSSGQSGAPNINYILNKAGAIPTDACLDVPGLPQSATGQTTIFTGQMRQRSCPGICTDNPQLH